MREDSAFPCFFSCSKSTLFYPNEFSVRFMNGSDRNLETQTHRGFMYKYIQKIEEKNTLHSAVLKIPQNISYSILAF